MYMKKLLLLPLFFTLASCTKFTSIDSRPTNSESRVTSVHEKLTYENNGVIVTDEMDPHLNFVYESKIAPPMSVKQTYAGNIQATGVTFLPGSKMIVSYNTKTEVIEGGFDIVDISNIQAPVILYSYVLSNYEFADLKFKDGKIYLAGVKQDIGSVLLTIDVSNFSSPQTIDEKLLSSYYATSLSIKDNSLLVVTGDSGDGYVFDINSAGVPQETHHEARSNLLYIKHYNTGLVYLHDEAGKTVLSNGDAVTGLTTKADLRNVHFESPARFDINGHIAYIATADEQVIERVDLNTMTKLATIPTTGRGNGIRYDSGLLYTAQGEEGFKLFDVRDEATPVYKGRFNFSDRSSANNVWTYDLPTKKVVVLADGLGGVKIISQLLSSLPPNYCTNISAIVSYSPLGNVPANRKDTSKALGAPQGDQENVINFVSLGRGGSIVVSFDVPVKNVSGPDLRAYEVSHGGLNFSQYPEQARVYGSNDLVTWVDLGVVKNDNGNPSLGDIELGSMTQAKYIKLVDITASPAQSDGYDLDGMTCLNQMNAPVCDASTNFIKNGSFEERSDSAGLVNGVNLNDLNSSGQKWDVYDLIPSWIREAGSGIELQVNALVSQAFDGTTLLELDSNPSASRPEQPYNTKVSQTVELASGNYKLSLQYKPRVMGESSDMKILIDDVVVQSVTASSPDWSLIEVAIPALPVGNHKISLQGDGTSDGVGAFVDSVSLKQICQ